MLDSRIIDLSFNKVFLKLVLGEEVPLTIATLKVSFPLTCITTILMVHLSLLMLTSLTHLQKCKVWPPKATLRKAK